MNITDITCLIIDDVETVRKELTKTLNELGIEKVLTSDSLLESWNIINDEKIDVIYCDWNMPKGDGIDLLKRLRESEKIKHRLQKFIMVTGSNEKVLQAMDIGANNVIHKPFSKEIIKIKLETIFNQIF